MVPDPQQVPDTNQGLKSGRIQVQAWVRVTLSEKSNGQKGA